MELDQLLKIRKNEYHLEQLCSVRSIVPFVGAGMSASMYPMWRKFLEGFDLLPDEREKLNNLLDKGEYEEAASFISSQSKRIFIEDVKSTFSPDKIDIKNFTESLILLPDLVDGLIITTNLDEALERVWEQHGTKFASVITPDCEDQLNRAITNGKGNTLIKLHGTVQEFSKYVITKEQYDEFYGVDSSNTVNYSKPFPQGLGRLFYARTILFIGCSLKSDRVLHLLKEIAQNNEHITHYAFLALEDDEKSDSIITREQELAEYGIMPIWFPKGDFASITILLDYIIKQKQYMQNNNIQNQQIFFDICKEIVKGMKNEVENKDSYISLSDKETVKSLFDNGLYIAPKESLSNMSTIIKGNAGCGKSLLLIKKFIETAEEFLKNKTYHPDLEIPLYCQIRNLDEKIKTISDFIKNHNKNYDKIVDKNTHFKFSFYLDGLDEIKQEIHEFIKTDIFNNCVLMTCREEYYNSKKYILPDSLIHINIKEWNNEETKSFIEKYCDVKKINYTEIENAIKFICEKKRGIFTPFLISLFLYVIRYRLWENEENDNQIEVSILSSAMGEYIKKEISKNEEKITDIKAISIIAEACWLHYYYHHPKNRKNKYTYSESYKDKISDALKTDKNIVDKYLKIVLKEDLGNVIFIMHEKIYEFLIAKAIVDRIIQNRDSDIIFSINYKPEILWYIVSLCRYDDNYVKVAEICKEKYIQKFNCENMKDYNVLISLINCLMFFARTVSPGPDDFIIDQLNNKLEENYTLQFALYESIMQYSKNLLISQKYEEIFYNRLLKEPDFEKIHRGSRLVYYSCDGATMDYVIRGDQGKCDWRVFFDNVKKHFQEENHNDKHYISRRVELITIRKLLETDHVNNKFPDFIDDIENFLSKIKPNLYEKAKSGDEFDIKVKECYDLFFKDLDIRQVIK